ncbi:GDSL-type esterase/lipase family protein [Hymenobacter sp. 5317J-9]|uniref:SGNH/GDSL hydrolase family protein n=1 Tax=Hymenobacter sp. 5317J-9 TaxID=2932250 RepID=UPI001FD66AA1|nr:GDSL-type esterase/lipase family protein [Hymenobacter sp. 5317J-9]UOQ96627.1 GDSL-type esterase/lipase family protein [Hymenobacter sp. 5317J-9]
MLNPDTSQQTDALYALIGQYFEDNTTGSITPADARLVLGSVADAINAANARLDALTTNQVKGSVFRVPYLVMVNGALTVPTNLIPARFRIVGMDVRVVNGTDQTSAAAGVRADPVDFRLLANSTGTINALVDELPATTATVKAAFVRTSGTEEDRVLSYPVLPLEDARLSAGEVYQYTFVDLVPPVTRLVEVRNDMSFAQNPLPTGLDSDPYYKPFAPLSAAVGYDDTALQNRVAAVATAMVDTPAKFLALVDTAASNVEVSISVTNGKLVLTANPTGAPQPKRQAVAIGDSETEGYGLGADYQTKNWLARLGVVGADLYDLVVNKGISGNTTAQMLARIADIKASFNATGRAGIDTYTLGGYNDFDETRLGASVADVVARLSQLVAGYKTAQVAGRDKNYLMTLPATAGYYTNVAGGSAAMDARITVKINDLNAYIRANYAAMGYDGYVDIARIVEAQSPTNSANTTDGLHFSAFLADLIAQAVATYERNGAQPTGPIISNPGGQPGTYVENPSTSVLPFTNPTLTPYDPARIQVLVATGDGSRVQSLVYDGTLNLTAFSHDSFAPVSTDWVGEAEFLIPTLDERILGLSVNMVAAWGDFAYSMYAQANGTVAFLVGPGFATPVSGGNFAYVPTDKLGYKLTKTQVIFYKNGQEQARINRTESGNLRVALGFRDQQVITNVRSRAYSMV